jgi:hypothetical protein
MTQSGIGFSVAGLEAMRVRLREGQLNALRGLLPDSVIWQACDGAGYAYRQRLLTPLVVILHYLSAALWPEDSFQAAAACASLGASSGSLSKARQRLPRAVMDNLSAYVAELGQYLSRPHAFHRGLRVVTVDGTCLSMADTPKLRGEFGIVNTKHGHSKYPEARLVVASLARTGTILSHRLGPYRTSEQALAMEALKSLQSGDLLVADAHFAGSNLYYKYMEQGLQFVTPAHQCLKVKRLRRVRKFADGSFLAVVPVWKSHRRKYPHLPEAMTLRFVPVRLRSKRGNLMSHLATSLLDADLHPAQTIREYYAMRWPVETTFADLKHPLSADVLRSRTVEGVYKEVAAKITALNLVRCLMLQAADRYECDPGRLSFAQCRRVTVAYSLRMSSAPIRLLPELFDEMLQHMAFVINPSRPGRIEPRAVRREFKHFERLKTTRREWRLQHGLTA